MRKSGRGSLVTVGLLALVCCASCADRSPEPVPNSSNAKVGSGAETPPKPADQSAAATPRDYKVAHVFVALCDNEHQGIVKVPEKLGNGTDLVNNLYWGAMYGVKTFFGRSKDWSALKVASKPGKDSVLERCVFKCAGTKGQLYVVADACDGAKMKETLMDFLSAAAGTSNDNAQVEDAGRAVQIQCGGRADVVCFVGHNGMMDVTLPEFPLNGEAANPACSVVLACKSHSYFIEPLKKAGCVPLITTTGFMAPEAYVLDAVLRSWADGDDPEKVRMEAGKAYAKYQKIGEKAGVGLFLSGWGD